MLPEGSPAWPHKVQTKLPAMDAVTDYANGSPDARRSSAFGHSGAARHVDGYSERGISPYVKVRSDCAAWSLITLAHEVWGVSIGLRGGTPESQGTLVCKEAARVPDRLPRGSPGGVRPKRWRMKAMTASFLSERCPMTLVRTTIWNLIRQG